MLSLTALATIILNSCGWRPGLCPGFYPQKDSYDIKDFNTLNVLDEQALVCFKKSISLFDFFLEDKQDSEDDLLRDKRKFWEKFRVWSKRYTTLGGVKYDFKDKTIVLVCPGHKKPRQANLIATYKLRSGREVSFWEVPCLTI